MDDPFKNEIKQKIKDDKSKKSEKDKKQKKEKKDKKGEGFFATLFGGHSKSDSKNVTLSHANSAGETTS